MLNFTSKRHFENCFSIVSFFSLSAMVRILTGCPSKFWIVILTTEFAEFEFSRILFKSALSLKKCGKLKFLKCQKVREIQIKIPEISKNAGKYKLNLSKVKKCGKLKLKSHKCQNMRENSNWIFQKKSKSAGGNSN